MKTMQGKRLWQIALALLLTTMVTASCAWKLKPVRMILEQAEDDGGRYVLPLKSRVLIVLDPITDAGYIWMTTEFNSSILRRAGREAAREIKQLKQYEGDRTALGFEAIAEGITDVNIAYCHPLNCEATTKKTFTVKFKVEKKSRKH